MLDPSKVFQAIFLKPFGYVVEEMVEVIAKLRLARALASVFCGASLALAGLLMQTTTRNPLADPYIFGLSSTALTLFALGILLVPNLMVHKAWVVAISFSGSILGYTLTLLLSKLGGGTSTSMVLAGIAVASLFSGASHVLLYLVQQVTRTYYMYLLMGSASTVLWTDLQFLTFPSISLAVLTLALFKPLNAYLYGDEYAKQLGFNPAMIRNAMSLVASLLTAITIASVGIVGFVGLIAPHVARFLAGSDHRFSIPMTALVGALVALIADTFVKLTSAFVGGLGELPLGVVTSIIGSPFLAYIVVRRSMRK